MWPTRRSMSSRRRRYWSTRSRDGRRHLHEDRVLDAEVPVGDQLAEGAQPGVDALGVVEPVDAEEDLRRVAEVAGGSGRPASRPPPSGPAPRTRRSRSRSGRPARDHAAVGQVDLVAVGLVPHPLPHQAHEVLGGAGELEADQVGAEQALEDLAPPRQLAEQLGRRERDVQVEADPQVGAQLAQHRGHQLELVVLHPHDRALGGVLRGGVGEALVDRHVGVPPLAVELRLGHEVVVERPEGGVGEALVELLDLLLAEARPAPG